MIKKYGLKFKAMPAFRVLEFTPVINSFIEQNGIKARIHSGWQFNPQSLFAHIEFFNEEDRNFVLLNFADSVTTHDCVSST